MKGQHFLLGEYCKISPRAPGGVLQTLDPSQAIVLNNHSISPTSPVLDYLELVSCWFFQGRGRGGGGTTAGVEGRDGDKGRYVERSHDKVVMTGRMPEKEIRKK